MYVKYGTLDLDYGSTWYKPDWINQVRKVGISLRGLPRQEQQIEPYNLSVQDLHKFERYWIAHQKIQPLLDDVSSTVRQATMLAGDYFEGCMKRNKKEDKLIDLTIALEALFSPAIRTS